MSAPKTLPTAPPEPKLSPFEVALSDTRSAHKTAAKRVQRAVVHQQLLLSYVEDGSVPNDADFRRLARTLRKAYDGIVFVGQTFADLEKAYRFERSKAEPTKAKAPLPPNMRAIIDDALANPLDDGDVSCEG